MHRPLPPLLRLLRPSHLHHSPHRNPLLPPLRVLFPMQRMLPRLLRPQAQVLTLRLSPWHYHAFGSAPGMRIHVEYPVFNFNCLKRLKN